MKRVGRVGAIIGAVGIAACFSKPGAPHVGDGDGGVDGDGGQTDGRVITDARPDTPPPTCTNQPRDTFDSGTSCGAIGSAYGPPAAVSRFNNQLRIDGAGSGGGCFSLNAFDFSYGTSLKVVQVAASVNNNYTNFRVYNGANMAEGMAIIFNSSAGAPSVIDITCIGSPGVDEKDYNAVTHAYWKFEAEQAALGTNVRAFYGPDGNNWTDTGVVCTWSSTATVEVDISVDPSGAALSMPALFDDFNAKTCVP